MSESPGPSLRLGVALVPYVAVPMGMYWLKSGWAAMLLYHAGIVIACVALRGGDSVRALGRGWNTPVALGFAVLCLGSGAVLYVLWPFLSGGGGAELSTKLEGLGLSGTSWIGFMIYYTAVNPWLEELFWRGLLGSEATGPVLADVLFAGYHILVLVVLLPWYWAVAAAVALTGGAWFWRQLARRFGGLLVPCVTHLVADASIIVAGHLLIRGL